MLYRRSRTNRHHRGPRPPLARHKSRRRRQVEDLSTSCRLPTGRHGSSSRNLSSSNSSNLSSSNRKLCHSSRSNRKSSRSNHRSHLSYHSRRNSIGSLLLCMVNL